MKTIGILGGSSAQATVEYYKLINELANERLGGWDTAEVIINSVNFGHIERFVRTEDWAAAALYLSEKTQALERAGAQLLVCVSNTLHRVADAFTRGLRIPFIHIVDPTGEAIRAAGLQRVGLLGTRPVMATDYLQRRYREKFGLEIVVPTQDEQALVDRIIFDELVRRILTAESKQAYLDVVDRLEARGAQGVILGCTEIFLLINQPDRPGLPMFDTASLHVRAAVDAALREDEAPRAIF